MAQIREYLSDNAQATWHSVRAIGIGLVIGALLLTIVGFIIREPVVRLTLMPFMALMLVRMISGVFHPTRQEIETSSDRSQFHVTQAHGILAIVSAFVAKAFLPGGDAYLARVPTEGLGDPKVESNAIITLIDHQLAKINLTLPAPQDFPLLTLWLAYAILLILSLVLIFFHGMYLTNRQTTPRPPEDLSSEVDRMQIMIPDRQQTLAYMQLIWASILALPVFFATSEVINKEVAPPEIIVLILIAGLFISDRVLAFFYYYLVKGYGFAKSLARIWRDIVDFIKNLFRLIVKYAFYLFVTSAVLVFIYFFGDSIIAELKGLLPEDPREILPFIGSLIVKNAFVIAALMTVFGIVYIALRDPDTAAWFRRNVIWVFILILVIIMSIRELIEIAFGVSLAL